MAIYEYRNVTVEFCNNGIRLRLTDEGREELASMRENSLPTYLNIDSWVIDLTEDMWTNGWGTFDPSQHGLTSATIGLISPEGVCYWHERYAVENAVEALESSKGLFLLNGGIWTDTVIYDD